MFVCFHISSKAHWALYYCLIKRHGGRHNDKWTDALTRIASLCNDWYFSSAQKRKWMKPGELWGKLGFIFVTVLRWSISFRRLLVSILYCFFFIKWFYFSFCFCRIIYLFIHLFGRTSFSIFFRTFAFCFKSKYLKNFCL